MYNNSICYYCSHFINNECDIKDSLKYNDTLIDEITRQIIDCNYFLNDISNPRTDLRCKTYDELINAHNTTDE